MSRNSDSFVGKRHGQQKKAQESQNVTQALENYKTFQNVEITGLFLEHKSIFQIRAEDFLYSVGFFFDFSCATPVGGTCTIGKKSRLCRRFKSFRDARAKFWLS